jgi:peptidylprolyl isomerase domain and WD repeat-containing protein 1
MDEHEYEKKLNTEKDLEISKDFLFNSNVEFDESEQYAIFCSFHGIKIYSLANRSIDRVIGTKENERFVRVSVFQGKQMRNPNGNANITG